MNVHYAMSSLSSYINDFSSFIPGSVKTAAGLHKQISLDVCHITWMHFQWADWAGNKQPPRLYLALGYQDGFQIWDVTDADDMREIVSRKDQPIAFLKLLPLPDESPRSTGVDHQEAPPGEREGETDNRARGGATRVPPLHPQNAPMVAYVHGGATLVRLLSMSRQEVVSLLRLPHLISGLEATSKVLAVAMRGQIALFNACTFQSEVTLSTAPSPSPAFAIGPRWLAYNAHPPPPSLPPATHTHTHIHPLPPRSRSNHHLPDRHFVVGSAPGALSDRLSAGLQYLGQVGQRTLDSLLMPSQGHHHGSAAGVGGVSVGAGKRVGVGGSREGEGRTGHVVVRDIDTMEIVAAFDTHQSEPLSLLTFDPTGLLLFSCTPTGHTIQAHRAVLAHDDRHGEARLVDKDRAGRPSLTFEPLFTLNRGITPALITAITFSRDSRLIVVSSAKGTSHFFVLPPSLSPPLPLPSHTRHTRSHHTDRPTHFSPPPSLPYRDRQRSSGVGVGSDGMVVINAAARIKLGSTLLQEGLHPKCAILSLPSPSSLSLYVATRAGLLHHYGVTITPAVTPQSDRQHHTDAVPIALHPSSTDNDSPEVSVALLKCVPMWRPHKHFNEKVVPLGVPETGGTDGEDGARDKSERSDGRWLSYVETSTCLRPDRPLWMSPQLKLFRYHHPPPPPSQASTPLTTPRSDTDNKDDSSTSRQPRPPSIFTSTSINRMVREGEVPQRVAVVLKRGRGEEPLVHYEGGRGDENMQSLLAGALRTPLATPPSPRRHCVHHRGQQDGAAAMDELHMSETDEDTEGMGVDRDGFQMLPSSSIPVPSPNTSIMTGNPNFVSPPCGHHNGSPSPHRGLIMGAAAELGKRVMEERDRERRRASEALAGDEGLPVSEAALPASRPVPVVIKEKCHRD
ncbi:unnamed protein product [Vitrella brassicaformis CCMP3155]|uniref:BCAS3 WD40 domain-containing protein n=3 Tax=Vitrella brassicaformis TaxID=1169539 RepID=A0A0G4FLH6_VITBC|nr:unnamed protein product [Vitrella brassicaformis CCMP3155]|eukprot:CEM14624.1 unnamed protein product [Vitrella brassicaformis CCMP3155]